MGRRNKEKSVFISSRAWAKRNRCRSKNLLRYLKFPLHKLFYYSETGTVSYKLGRKLSVAPVSIRTKIDSLPT